MGARAWGRGQLGYRKDLGGGVRPLKALQGLCPGLLPGVRPLCPVTAWKVEAQIGIQ